MNYFSTRGRAPAVGFSSAVMTGLAPDGGLFLPVEFPVVGRQTLARWKGLSYQDLAVEVMLPFVDIPGRDLRELVRKSYAVFAHPEVAPVVPLDGAFVLELFHGPTLSFKDIALQFLGNLFEHILAGSGGELNILAATSGDTGSAAIHGVRGWDRIRIFVMHPRGKVSASQERQMTTVLDDNVFNIAVEGTFDDCQRIMKAVFNDLEFKKRHSLGSVNSINWARVLAQIVYYFYSTLRVMAVTGSSKVSFTVPTGNFGDIFAAYAACRMGLPVDKLVLATNENDILARFFNSGIYARGQVHETLSPSMDIQVASNFERYLYFRTGENTTKVASLMAEFGASGRLSVATLADGRVDDMIVAGSADRAETLSTIRKTYEQTGYLLDPHTAVGVCVGRRHAGSQSPMVYVATAHPSKFGNVIADAVGKNVARHETIARLTDMPVRCRVLTADEEAVRSFIEGALRG